MLPLPLIIRCKCVSKTWSDLCKRVSNLPLTHLICCRSNHGAVREWYPKLEYTKQADYSRIGVQDIDKDDNPPLPPPSTCQPLQPNMDSIALSTFLLLELPKPWHGSCFWSKQVPLLTGPHELAASSISLRRTPQFIDGTLYLIVRGEIMPIHVDEETSEFIDLPESMLISDSMHLATWKGYLQWCEFCYFSKKMKV